MTGVGTRRLGREFSAARIPFVRSCVLRHDLGRETEYPSALGCLPGCPRGHSGTASRSTIHLPKDCRASPSPTLVPEFAGLRPQFHFTAPKGWMNDPSGVFYHNGLYHLHYQANPNPNGWGVDWGHAVSRDLVHWTHWPTAIVCDAGGACWSGSGVVDPNNTSGFRTGKDDVLMLIFTMNRPDGRQVVALAYSNDRGRTWTKYVNNPGVWK